VRPWASSFVAVAVVALSASGTARANGAFPDAESLLTPADRPQEIVLVTNFGLVSSTDNGQTWLWSCEQEGNALGMLYQLTPLPRNRLFAVSNQKLVYSDDRSCGWRAVASGLAGHDITDAFVDPTGGARVMAIGVANQVYSLFQSTDGGATFGAPLYQAPSGDTMNGVEFARADANVVYLALRSPDGSSRLGRSSDGGANFAFKDVSAALGPGMLRIIAIDPQDVNRVLFRFLGANDQSIALTVDGGATVTKPVTVNGFFNSFARLDNGTILIGGMGQFSSVPALFRSRDRGTTFEELARPPSIRALSQRNGTVYAVTDNFGDGYALGTSVDEGTTWRGMMSYADVKAINPCLKVQCQMTCDAEVMLSLWPAEVCAADPPPGSTGTGGGGAGAGGTIGGGGAGGSGTGGPPPPPKKGGCDIAATPGAPPLGLGMLGLLLFQARRRSSRSRAKRGPRPNAVRLRASGVGLRASGPDPEPEARGLRSEAPGAPTDQNICGEVLGLT